MPSALPRLGDTIQFSVTELQRPFWDGPLNNQAVFKTKTITYYINGAYPLSSSFTLSATVITITKNQGKYSVVCFIAKKRFS